MTREALHATTVVVATTIAVVMRTVMRVVMRTVMRTVDEGATTIADEGATMTVMPVRVTTATVTATVAVRLFGTIT